MLKKIDHIGIAVRSIEDVLPFYTELLGLAAADIVELSDQQVRVCMLTIGDAWLELIEPTSVESSVMKFLERRGEGLLHICFEVDEIHKQLDELAEHGCRLVDRQAWMSPHGLAAFVHPMAAHGVSIELRQYDTAKDQ